MASAEDPGRSYLLQTNHQVKAPPSFEWHKLARIVNVPALAGNDILFRHFHAERQPTAALHEKGTEMTAKPARARTGLPVGDATDRPTERRIGKGGILKGLCVAALAALATGAAVAPASASTASARGCQGASAAAVLHADPGTYHYTCSGAFYISTYAYTFDAGGWSGAVYTNNWGPKYFCDGDHLTLSVGIYEVYLNATKPARCS